jgi:hypothetical protein
MPNPARHFPAPTDSDRTPGPSRAVRSNHRPYYTRATIPHPKCCSGRQTLCKGKNSRVSTPEGGVLARETPGILSRQSLQALGTVPSAETAQNRRAPELTGLPLPITTSTFLALGVPFQFAVDSPRQQYSRAARIVSTSVKNVHHASPFGASILNTSIKVVRIITTLGQMSSSVRNPREPMKSDHITNTLAQSPVEQNIIPSHPTARCKRRISTS